MIEEIQAIIGKLDTDKDYFLIGLLETKIKELHQIELSKVSINDYEYRMAKNGCRVIAKNIFPGSKHKAYRKARALYDSINCLGCKHSIKHTYISIYSEKAEVLEDMDTNSIVCMSCARRCEILNNHAIKMEYSYLTDVEQFLKQDDIKEIIRCKAVITKINLKLKEK